MSQNRSLLVVGSVAFDDIDGPFGMHKNLLGGSASFFVEAAAYFTNRVSMVAVVGSDFPQGTLDRWRGRSIDVSGVEKRAGKTFHWSGKYANDLSTRETISTELGVFADFAPRLNPVQKNAELLFLGNIHPKLQLDVLEQVQAPELVALDTMNLWIRTERPALLQVLRRVQTLLINDEEARQLAGEHRLSEAARIIRGMGPHSVVIKRGDSGALLFYPEGVFAAPAMPLAEVKDPTGAGDAFAGGFMGYLAYAGRLLPADVRAAMIYGSVMGSFAVEQFSLDGLLDLRRDLIQKRFDAFRDLTQFEHITL
jgi:sugar/nucleoside kinase (ribokinase family)